MKTQKYYVTMTDKFMSGWGCAKNQIAKYVYICDSYEEAKVVERNAIQRGDQKYINICSRYPYYNKDRYHVEIKTKENCPLWYEPDFFK